MGASSLGLLDESAKKSNKNNNNDKRRGSAAVTTTNFMSQSSKTAADKTRKSVVIGNGFHLQNKLHAGGLAENQNG